MDPTRIQLESPQLPEAIEHPPSPLPGRYLLERLSTLARERARRKVETLKLYVPLPLQLLIHMSEALRRVIRGGNRSGKTLCAAVEICWALLGKHPWLSEYPKSDGRAFFVGRDQKHLGETMFRKLFYPGAFRVIADEETGEWRAFRNWDPADRRRRAESRPADPLIPARYIKGGWKGIAWENKKLGVPSKITLVNGWEISFFTGGGKPPRGADVDLVWFDEEITDPEWYPEMTARLLDRRGKFLWSATPQSGTDQLLDLHDQAQADRESAHPHCVEVQLDLDDNPHFDDDQKQAMRQDLSEEEIEVRIHGNFASYGHMMFPEFSTVTHGVVTSGDGLLEPYEVLPGGEPPDSWCRYLVVDPGSIVAAALFAAVPPPSVGNYVFVYDEVWLPKASATKLAEAIRPKVHGREFQAFVIDGKGSQRTEHGSGLTVRHQYSEAFKAAGIASVRTKHGFLLGCPEKLSRIAATKQMLEVRGDGTTRLRVVTERCPWLVRNLKRYRRKLDPRTKMPTEEPNDRGEFHQAVNLQYLAAFNPKYIKPKPKGRLLRSGAQLRWAQKREKLKNRRREPVHLGPK